MRVCHINLSRELRGGEQQTLALIQALAGLPEGREIDQALVVRQDSDFHDHCSALGGFELRPVPPSSVRAAIVARDADVVHVHEGRSTRVGALLSLRGIPFLITRRVPNRPKDFFLTKWVYSRAATIACVSRHVAEVMRTYSPSSSISVVYDSVRPLAEPAEPARPVPGELRVGVIGEIDFAHKGQDVLVPAARYLAERGIVVRFLLAGTGRDEPELRAMTADLDNFEFLGWIDDIGSLLLDIDVVVHPARKEGLGSVLLEAMSLGKPVVAAAVGGIPEIIRHGRNGFLVKPESSKGVADALAKLDEDRQMLAKLAEGARSTAREFSAQRMAEQYLRIYEQLVHAGGTMPSST